MEGGVQEVSPCCQCVQGGRGCALCRYGVPLVVWAVGDENVGGRQFVHFGGVGEVPGDVDLSGVVLARGGVWDDVVGRRRVVGGFSCCIQFERGVERFWRQGFSLGFRVRRHFGFDQVLWAPGLRGPDLGGCRCGASEEGGDFWVHGGGRGWLGGQGIVVLICPPIGVAPLGVAVWSFGLGLLDG